MPLIACGDWNNTPQELADAGWLQVSNLVPVWPRGVCPTLYGTPDRIIDYALVSHVLKPCIYACIPNLWSPWRPHISWILSPYFRPRQVVGNFLIKPMPLPMSEANTQYAKNRSEVNQIVWQNAWNVSFRKLSKARAQSGISILGSPPRELLDDPKFKGEYTDISIQCGEDLAASSLATEIFVLNIAGIDPKGRHKYIGRSQYPKFRRKPVPPRVAKGSRYYDKDLQNCVSVVNALQVFIEQGLLTSDNLKVISRNFLPCRDIAPIPVRDAIDGLLLYSEVESFLQNASPEQRNTLFNCFVQIRDQLYNKIVNACNKQWRHCGKEQFSGHAKAMFSYVSKQDKQHLSSDHLLDQGSTFSPDAALKTQTELWGSR